MRLVVKLRCAMVRQLRAIFRWLRGFRSDEESRSRGAPKTPVLGALVESCPTGQGVNAAGVETSDRERHIVVGVDFGTSTTKVIWQDLAEGRFEIMTWSSGGIQSSTRLLPSTMVVRNGNL
ncbi:MAG: hypothetical protein NZ823_17025, partial [Blastocatellia bacterium]|nr:hypothetical protein [Blastocatellia bacterium]